MSTTLAADGVGLLNPDTLSDLTDPLQREANAWIGALRRFGLDRDHLPLSPADRARYHRLLHEGHADWIMTRARGTSLIVVEPETAAWLVAAQRRENDRRDMMTRTVCEIVAMAMVDAVFRHLTRQHQLLGSSDDYRRSAIADGVPSYTTIRDHLFGDCGASYLLACEVAFATTTRQRRIHFYRERMWWDTKAERGWL